MPEPNPQALSVTACEQASLAVILLRRGKAAEATRALQAQRGLDLPLPGRMSAGGGDALLWNGPDRFLAVCEAGNQGLARELGGVLDGLAYVAEASSSRSVLTVSGEWAAEMLNRLVPVDLHPRGFPLGSVALTIAARIPLLIWRRDAGSFRLACPSSLAASFQRRLAEL